MSYVIFISVLLITMYVIFYYTSRRSQDEAITLNFFRWKKLYEVKPKNWMPDLFGPVIIYKPNCQYINISLSTWWIFFLWRRMNYRRKVKKKQIEMTQEFLSYIQDDIDELKEETNRQFKECMRILLKSDDE